MSLLRKISGMEIVFADRTVSLTARDLRRFLRESDDRQVETRAADLLQAMMSSGFWVRIHIYSRDPLDIGLNVTQEQPEDRDDSWWLRE